MKIVVTKQGKLQGKVMDGYTVFYGVPFAKPPIGELRFRLPQPPENYDGVRDASFLRERPWQPAQPLNTPCGKEFYFDPKYLPPMSENCLFVHIWTPAQTPEERLPVTVWIHGGAFSKGFGTEVEFDGEGFCRRGVILVTVEYRLGPLGFLCYPDLDNERGIQGNYGIWDQIAALHWVQDNIEAFGGDPKRITIMGQSAGAISVQILVLSGLIKKIVSGAIMQSGGGYPHPFYKGISKPQAEKNGILLAKLCGVNSLQNLKKIPAKQLTEAAEQLRVESGNLLFSPIIDGQILSDSLDHLVESGNICRIPYLLGSNANDIGKNNSGENSLHCAAVGWGIQCNKLGKIPSYVYRFDRIPPGNDTETYQGAYHSAELWYVFETLSRSWRPFSESDHLLSSKMADYWCQFIKTGNPNGKGMREWHPCLSEKDVMIFDV